MLVFLQLKSVHNYFLWLSIFTPQLHGSCNTSIMIPFFYIFAVVENATALMSCYVRAHILHILFLYMVFQAVIISFDSMYFWLKMQLITSISASQITLENWHHILLYTSKQ